MTPDTRMPTKTAYVLIVLCVALAGAALAPAAAATGACQTGADPVTNGQLYSYHLGTCYVFVDVLGDQVYPLP
jgi:hypothetical protein